MRDEVMWRRSVDDDETTLFQPNVFIIVIFRCFLHPPVRSLL